MSYIQKTHKAAFVIPENSESSSREKAKDHQLQHLGLIDIMIGGKIQYCVFIPRKSLHFEGGRKNTMEQDNPKCGSGMLARGLASQRNGWGKRIEV